MDFGDTGASILKTKETYINTIINHYERLNGRNNQLVLLFYFLNHLILLDFECTSFSSLQVKYNENI